MRISEPSNGRNRAQYQHAIDALAPDIAKFVQFNPSREPAISIRVRWYSKQSGYLAQAGYGDSISGGWTPIAVAWSR